MTKSGEVIRKTCRRYDIPGHAHFLTFSCFKKKPFLGRDRSCQWLADAIANARHSAGFDLWAYVFMPEHVHLVLLPHEDVAISRVLQLIKQPVTQAALAFVRRSAPGFLAQMAEVRPAGTVAHRFWMPGGGYDRNLISAQEIHEKIQYVHANPVRRILVESPEQWKWSSYRSWMTGEDQPIPLDRTSVPQLNSRQ